MLVPALAVAGPQQDANALMAKAQKAHAAGDFPKALEHLMAAYEADPLPDLLYAIAQVHVKLDNCVAAIDFYEQFLGTSPSEAAAKDTREAIESCKAKLPPPPPPEPAPAPLPPPPPPPPPSLPWYRDAIGAGLVAGGVIVGATGIFVYTAARADLDDAENATDHQQYLELVDNAGSKRILSVVLMGSGAALVGYGVTRILMKSPEDNVTVVPTSGGGMVTWGGSF